MTITRRGLLGGLAGGGLLVGAGAFAVFRWRGHDEPVAPKAKVAAWLHVGDDDSVTVAIPRAEMGQGIASGLAGVVAQELGARHDQMRTTWAPIEPEYGEQRTGASDSMRTFADPLQRAAAVVRELLVAEAAARWGVEPIACRSHAGAIEHAATKRTVKFGELASAAAARESGEPTLRADAERAPFPRLDLRAKVDGTAGYGLDVRVPGMLFAMIERCPVFGGTVRAFHGESALAVPGVKRVVPVMPFRFFGAVKGLAPTGVAIVADSTWAAKRGREALAVEWDLGAGASLDSAAIEAMLETQARAGKAKPLVERGDLAGARKTAAHVLDATYHLPFLPHLGMEPIACTAHVEAKRARVWVPTQGPARARDTVARYTGLSPEQIEIERTYIGGGFGRRLVPDDIAEAVQVSQAVGAPVQVVWTREDDLQHDFYRPATCHLIGGGVDASGLPTFVEHRIGGIGTDTQLALGLDIIPYAIANKRVVLERPEWHDPGTPVTTGPWRGVSHTQNGYVVEHFLDELAHLGGRDPVELRLALLAGAPRHRAVVELCADKAGWAKGRAMGLAVHDITEKMGGGICAIVVELDPAGGAMPKKITAALDCGRVIHEDSVRAQVAGGVIYALGAALYGKITVREGRVVESNFHEQRVLRQGEIPPIEVHLVAGQTDVRGVGEAAVPALAPAIANALLASAGTPTRRLPFA